MGSPQQLRQVQKRLLPAAVVPLIEVYTRDGRGWGSTRRRVSAQDQLLQAVNQAKDVDSLREWTLSQRYSGVLVETWFAFRCFDPGLEVVFPDSELEIARLVIRTYVNGFQRLYGLGVVHRSASAETTT